jgi:hypothetical protein
MGNQIYFKIAGYVDLAVLIIFTYVLFLVTATMLVGARHQWTQF